MTGIFANVKMGFQFIRIAPLLIDIVKHVATVEAMFTGKGFTSDQKAQAVKDLVQAAYTDAQGYFTLSIPIETLNQAIDGIVAVFNAATGQKWVAPPVTARRVQEAPAAPPEPPAHQAPAQTPLLGTNETDRLDDAVHRMADDAGTLDPTDK